jgi:hypothetical protein
MPSHGFHTEGVVPSLEELLSYAENSEAEIENGELWRARTRLCGGGDTVTATETDHSPRRNRDRV